MTTSNTNVPVWLQVNEYIEKRATAKKSIGKRAMHKATGELGTIKKAYAKDQGTLYYLNLDSMSHKLALAVWEDGLVIVGEAQF